MDGAGRDAGGKFVASTAASDAREVRGESGCAAERWAFITQAGRAVNCHQPTRTQARSACSDISHPTSDLSPHRCPPRPTEWRTDENAGAKRML